jgi:hypothetical protein
MSPSARAANEREQRELNVDEREEGFRLLGRNVPGFRLRGLCFNDGATIYRDGGSAPDRRDHSVSHFSGTRNPFPFFFSLWLKILNTKPRNKSIKKISSAAFSRNDHPRALVEKVRRPSLLLAGRFRF